MAVLQSEVRPRLTLALWRLLWIALPVAGLLGCQRLPFFSRAPRAAITTPAGATLAQTGEAQTPAAVSSDVTEIEIPVAAFVTTQGVTAPATSQPGLSRAAATPQTAPAAVTPRSADSAGASLRITTRRESATAPRAFAPPSPAPPPTAAEQARASVFRWFALAGLLGLVAAGLLAWAQHYLAAVKVAAGAVALPVLGHLFGSAVAMTVSVGLVALGAGMFAAWHVLKARNEIVT